MERPILELLEIVLKHTPDLMQSSNCDGLCSVTNNLAVRGILTSNEEEIIDAYIRYNAPNRLVDLGNGSFGNSIFKWDPNLIEPRVEWLKSEIKRLEYEES